MNFINGLLLFALVVVFVFGAAKEAFSYPVYVKPLTNNNTQPFTTWNYTFNFTSDSSCNNVLLSNNTLITTRSDGIGFVNINTSSLGEKPDYLCEYRNGSLRAVHQFQDGFFDRLLVGEIISPQVTSNETDDNNIEMFDPGTGGIDFTVNGQLLLSLTDDYILYGEDLLPLLNVTFDLGNRDSRWKDIWVGGSLNPNSPGAFIQLYSDIVLIGNSSNTNGSGEDAIAIGVNASVNAFASIAMGVDPQVNSSGGIAIGQAAIIDNNSRFSILVGNGARADNAEYGVAIGHASKLQDADFATAVGFNAKANASNCVAIGPNSYCNETGSVAFGPGAVSEAIDCIAIGNITCNETGQFRIDNRYNKVSIGLADTETVDATLHVNGTTILSNTTTIKDILNIETAINMTNPDWTQRIIHFDPRCNDCNMIWGGFDGASDDYIKWQVGSPSQDPNDAEFDMRVFTTETQMRVDSEKGFLFYIYGNHSYADLGSGNNQWRNMYINGSFLQRESGNIAHNVTLSQIEEAYNFSQNHSGGTPEDYHNQSLNTTDNVTFNWISFDGVNAPLSPLYHNAYVPSGLNYISFIQAVSDGIAFIPFYFIATNNATSTSTKDVLSMEGIATFSTDPTGVQRAWGQRLTAQKTVTNQNATLILVGSELNIDLPSTQSGGKITQTGLDVDMDAIITTAGSANLTTRGIDLGDSESHLILHSNTSINQTGLYIGDWSDNSLAGSVNDSYSIFSLDGKNYLGGNLSVNRNLTAQKYASSNGGVLGFTLTESSDDLILRTDVQGNNFFSIETDGAFLSLYANPNPSVDYLLFTVSETQGADTEINFYEGGTGHNRFWDSGSARFGGAAGSTCDVLDVAGLVDCDTPATGADVVIQDELLAMGGVIAGNTTETINLTDGGNIVASGYKEFNDGYFYVYDNIGAQGINSANLWTNLTFDTTVRNDTLFDYNADTANITINQDGWYKVTYIYMLQENIASRCSSRGRLVIDTDGTGYSEISGSRIGSYHRDLGNDEVSASGSIIHEFTSGDVLAFQVQEQTCGVALSTVADSTKIMVEKI